MNKLYRGARDSSPTGSEFDIVVTIDDLLGPWGEGLIFSSMFKQGKILNIKPLQLNLLWPNLWALFC